jgi:hypothetical protein
MTLTHRRLTELLELVGPTLFWKIDHGKMRAGDPAGSLKKENGHRKIGIDYKEYAAPRLAYFYTHKKWPKGLVGHKNRDVDNQSPVNIEDSNYSRIAANAKTRITNRSGSRGVHWASREGAWCASMMFKSTPLSLGFYDDKEIASQVIAAAREEIFGTCETVKQARAVAKRIRDNSKRPKPTSTRVKIVQARR